MIAFLINLKTSQINNIFTHLAMCLFETYSKYKPENYEHKKKDTALEKQRSVTWDKKADIIYCGYLNTHFELWAHRCMCISLHTS